MSYFSARTQNPPLPLYQRAFEQLMKCKKEDYEMKQSYKDGPYLAKYSNAYYEISSSSDISNTVLDMLEDPELFAMEMPIDIWIDACEGVHFESEFAVLLYEDIDDAERKIVDSAYLVSGTSNDAETFWGILMGSGNLKILGQAIWCAYNVYDKHSIANDIVEDVIANGDTFFNQLQEGLFESVDIDPENDLNDKGIFYVYTVDSTKWTI